MHSENWRRKIILFLTSQAITLLGTSVVQMAVIWYVTLETSSGIWITILTLSSYLPQMLISFFSGAFADRYNRKMLVIAADGIIALATLGLAFFLIMDQYSDKSLTAILIISIIRSLGSGIQTPAVNAIVPQIVPEQHLMRFNGINSSIQSLVQFAAPAVAGAVLAIGTLDKILMIDVGTAIVGIFILSFIKIPKLVTNQEQEKGSIMADIKSSLNYVSENKYIGKLFANYGLFIFLSVPSGFMTALMIERTFGNNYTYLSINEMVGCAGMVLGGVLIGILGGFKDRNRTLFGGMMMYSLFSIILGFSTHYWLFACVMFGLSFFIPIIQSATMTILQENVLPEMQGRIFSMLHIMFTGFMPLGMVIFGPLSDVVKINYLPIVAGALLAVITLIIYIGRAMEKKPKSVV